MRAVLSSAFSLGWSLKAHHWWVIKYHAEQLDTFALKNFYFEKQFKMHQIQKKWKKLVNMDWLFLEGKHHFGNSFVLG